jgi:hypothetical protein
MIYTEKRTLLGGALASTLPLETAGPSLDLLAVRLPEATRISGLSRSEIYRRAGRGEIILLKCGKSTLVEMTSLRATLAALPRASIRPTNQSA